MDPVTPELRAILTIECEQVPDEVRQGLELIRVCNADLQHLVELRLECLQLLERRPKVLQRVDGIIEAANQQIMEVGKIIEKCRSDANKGKTSFGRRAAWMFLDSKEFQSHEPIISRHHASVLAELNFLRQILLLAPPGAKDDSGSGKGPADKKDSIAFDNLALLGDLMGGLSVSNPQTLAANPAINTSVNPTINPTRHRPARYRPTRYRPTPAPDSSALPSPPPPPYSLANSRPRSLCNLSAASSPRPSVSSHYSDHVRSQRQSRLVGPPILSRGQVPPVSQHAGLALLFDDLNDARPVSALSNNPPSFIAELPDRPQTFVAELLTEDVGVHRRLVPKPSQDLSHGRSQSDSFPTYPGGPKPYSQADTSIQRPPINHTTSLPAQASQQTYNPLQIYHGRASISGYPGTESHGSPHSNQQNHDNWQAPYPADSAIPAISVRRSVAPKPSIATLAELDATSSHQNIAALAELDAKSSHQNITTLAELDATSLHENNPTRDDASVHSAQWPSNESVSRPSTAFSAYSAAPSLIISPQLTGARPLDNTPGGLLCNYDAASQPRHGEAVRPAPLFGASSFTSPPGQSPEPTRYDDRTNTCHNQPTGRVVWDDWSAYN